VIKLHHGRDGMSAPPLTDERLYQACLDGREPADILRSSWRDELVHKLHRRGWTDVEIATHTRMTTYTTARIRSRMKLQPNVIMGDAA
jgi:hypothetical protein